MSYDTRLEIRCFAGGELNVDDHEEGIAAILDDMGMHPMVMNDLRDAFEDGEATFNMHAGYLVELCERIAKLAPDVAFEARGLGEEFRDTWVRGFENGVAIFAAGPWGYD